MDRPQAQFDRGEDWLIIHEVKIIVSTRAATCSITLTQKSADAAFLENCLRPEDRTDRRASMFQKLEASDANQEIIRKLISDIHKAIDATGGAR